MTPDLPTIARRRHLVTIMLRVCVVLWVGYVAVFAIDLLLDHLDGLMMGGVGALVFSFAIPVACKLALAGVVLLVEKPLVRWLVPVMGSDNTCPKCGYSLKNLKSPVCPECGMNLRPGA